MKARAGLGAKYLMILLENFSVSKPEVRRQQSFGSNKIFLLLGRNTKNYIKEVIIAQV